MAFCFQVGPSVLGLVWSGTCRAGAVVVAGTYSHPGSGTWNWANISSGFRARHWTDATPGTGTGIGTGKPGVCVKSGFDVGVVNWLSVFHGICIDPGSTHRVLLDPVN